MLDSMRVCEDPYPESTKEAAILYFRSRRAISADAGSSKTIYLRKKSFIFSTAD